MKSKSPRVGRPRAEARGRTSSTFTAALAAVVMFIGASQFAAAATKNEPKGLATMRALALELLRVEDYERSIEVYVEITRHTPNDPKSYYDLAGALSFIKLYEEAVEPIRTAIRLDPDNVRAQEMAALIFLNLKRYEEAFAATLKSAELGEPTAMYSLVNMYEKGLGVKANQEQAAYWAERAAERGHLGAMAIMEEAYRTGRFERQVDPDLADAWAIRLRAAE